jgi:hypothetical protein
MAVRMARCFSAFARTSSARRSSRKVGVADLALGRLLEERRQLGLDAVKPQPVAVGMEALELWRAHAAPPASAMAA